MTLALPTIPKPIGFGVILRTEIRKHGDTIRGLSAALKEGGASISTAQLSQWCRDRNFPSKTRSIRALYMIEARYGLPHGHLVQKLYSLTGYVSCYAIRDIPHQRRTLFAWHLPHNFLELPATKQAEIKSWIAQNVFYGLTEFRKYQSKAVKHSFKMKFLVPDGQGLRQPQKRRSSVSPDHFGRPTRQLAEEIDALISFKTATLPPEGKDRLGRWNAASAETARRNLGLFFGALASSPDGRVGGFGVPVKDLTIAILVFPAVWDWYVMWREKRRGFYTAYERSMVSFAKSLVRNGTGWLRQNRWLASRLKPITGLISAADIRKAQCAWDQVCDAMQLHAYRRGRALLDVEQVHRSSFEAIETILATDNPIREYRKITKEIITHVEKGGLSAYEEAQAIRAFLMMQFGLHLGLRQKNLRELLVGTSDRPTSVLSLVQKRRGELRWRSDTGKWEVLVPAIAFKNGHSRFFDGGKPYLCEVPDVDNLYAFIAAYLEKHRPLLVRAHSDPGTFFVKGNIKRKGRLDYDQASFYTDWREAVAKYGIYNPYTGRGAIKGLLPHGPHCIRDVLATYVLKKTGSIELAALAIHDSVPMIQKYYGRFLPSEKTALVMKTIGEAWCD